ncbi:transporter substrate-binding domain-containing protein [Rummeliibacillus suwonensis]|jgi:L-cystine transport system substrate-binding protein|uniref:transporter substrate-binding domain-containing protein n=1 Tax=Rummeliibacillus suwonensis TaxID=1306154 RepID=UPI0028971A55|nr:transporter substrate-binding domain-containing protein [Rummeliibacillus suwonensis]
MKLKKLGTLVAAFGLTASLLAACGSSSSSDGAEKEKNGKEIVKVALSDEVNPPFLYTDDNNKPVGYDIDYLNEIEKKLGDKYEFKYQFGEEESNLIGVSTNKFDFAINWFFKNPEREAKFLYGDPEYGYSLTALITRKDTNDIKTFEDLKGKKLAPMAPSGGLRTILNNYNEQHPDKAVKIETIEQPSNADNLKGLAEGKYDAVFLNVSTFNAVQKELNLDIKVGGIISKEPIYIVYNKKNEKIQKDINEATKELQEDGTLSKLATKWFDVDFFKDLDYINQKQYKFGN